MTALFVPLTRPRKQSQEPARLDNSLRARKPVKETAQRGSLFNFCDHARPGRDAPADRELGRQQCPGLHQHVHLCAGSRGFEPADPGGRALLRGQRLAGLWAGARGRSGGGGRSIRLHHDLPADDQPGDVRKVLGRRIEAIADSRRRWRHAGHRADGEVHRQHVQGERQPSLRDRRFVGRDADASPAGGVSRRLQGGRLVCRSAGRMLVRWLDSRRATGAARAPAATTS